MQDLTTPQFRYAFKVFRKFPVENLQDDIRWICHALDLIHPRDKDETVIRVFKTIIESAREGRGLTTTEIAEKLGYTRGTILNHLKRLVQNGLVIQRHSLYELREHSLFHTIQRIKEDVIRFVEDLLHVSEFIDRSYELQTRKKLDSF
ncbi:MAG: ArsR/SmtB family transcription factor [Candidatus Heimdallarchaeota archaeon]